MDIGSRIRFHRVMRGLSQRDLAASLRMAPAQLSRYETGRTQPGLAVLDRIAKVLRVPVSDFFFGR
ncbi:MAG TPA: helix-turn-helix transcriptional regulator [Planctomycetota bacterium]|nr:helix-turn-helix transcriptional regulator [Planctomycetota bacterium]